MKVRDQYDASIKGFSASMSEEQAKKLAGDERVAYVQQNQKITVSQDDPPWGLDRADQRDLPLDKKYEAATTADNVNVYVIDTGIYAEHKDFGGRASVGTDTVGDGQNGVDCMGHGSHVAGTIAGTTYGLAKGAKVFGVRVLDCSGSGSTESVVAGIDWVTKNAKKPAVANMSLGGGADDALDAAVKASVDSGVTYAVAAGNEFGRVRWLAGQGAVRDHGRRDRRPGPEGDVLELGHVRRPVRAWCRHHVGRHHRPGRDRQDERYVDGHAARGRWGRALPGRPPGRDAG